MLWVGLAGHFIGYNTVFMWAWKIPRAHPRPARERSPAPASTTPTPRSAASGATSPNESSPKIDKAMDDLAGPRRDAHQGRPRRPGPPRAAQERRRADQGGRAALRRGRSHRARLGVDIDVRRDDPYAAYDRVDWKVITQEAGDVFSKAVVRCLETLESIKIVKQCCTGDPRRPDRRRRSRRFPRARPSATSRPPAAKRSITSAARHQHPSATRSAPPATSTSPRSGPGASGHHLRRRHHPGLRRPLLQLHRADGSGREDQQEEVYTGKELVRLSEEKTHRMWKEAGR